MPGVNDMLMIFSYYKGNDIYGKIVKSKPYYGMRILKTIWEKLKVTLYKKI